MSAANCTTTYTCSHVKTIFLPFMNESTWRLEVRATLYLIGLIWLFMGISIIADIFMSAIEKITNSVRKITIFNSDAGTEEVVEVKIWNDTVANLTLMAMGSSAPEILLSIIEIVSNNFESGELGPSTIVGSAAFNLFVISAVCVVSVGPDGKRIKQFNVFCVTSAFSVFAYLWLVIILVWSTPDFVDLWEGVVTFLLFTILDGHIDEEQIGEFLKQLGKDPNLTETEMKQLVLKKFTERLPHSRAWYRMNATRALMGGHKLEVQLPERLQQKLVTLAARSADEVTDSAASLRDRDALTEGGKLAVVEFASASVAVLESDQRARLTIRRYGNTRVRALIKVETVDGTATKDEDYVPFKKTIVFEPGETLQHIDVEIVDDDQWEPDETFFVKMSLEKGQQLVKLGPKMINQVTIINDDEPGTFEFENASYLFKESCAKACVPVRRFNGADGIATVHWKTEDQTAKAGVSYEGGSGELTFSHGEIEKTIDIVIYDVQCKEKDEHFKLVLSDCSMGSKLGKISSTIITIVNDDEYSSFISRLAHAANVELDNIRVDKHTYADQFKEAMNVNGGDLDNATALDYIMHFLTFAWKTNIRTQVLFAAVPPPSIWGGWLCFLVALAFIGLLTALVIDLASLFGCFIGLKDAVTAITLVAIGTSLPDLYASKQAAANDDSADNAIGNVTGSNSVNVFLGLGLPWMMAAIYHSV
uniref:Calx-beta domain-containing protein n=1 Tax=Macrostomum lignano TaxID=282301 RepID=A0A1I8FVH8_9PLAT